MAKAIDWKFKQTGDFYRDLAMRESTGNHEAKTVGGSYLALYQFGEDTLMDTRYYKKPKNDASKQEGGKSNKWTGTWTGKNGINSQRDFLINPIVQEIAVREYHDIVWNRYLKDYQKYEGQTVGGIKLTKSGMLAMAHLVGHGQVKKFIDTNGLEVKADANGTLGAEYLSGFAEHSFNLTIAELQKQLDEKITANKEKMEKILQEVIEKMNEQIQSDYKNKTGPFKHREKIAMIREGAEKLQAEANKKLKDYKEHLEQDAEANIKKTSEEMQQQIDSQKSSEKSLNQAKYSAFVAQKQAEHDAEWTSRVANLEAQHRSDPTKSISADSSDIASRKQAEIDAFQTQLTQELNSKIKQLVVSGNSVLQDKITTCIQQHTVKLKDVREKVTSSLAKQLEKWNVMSSDELDHVTNETLDQEIAMVLQGVDAELLS